MGRASKEGRSEYNRKYYLAHREQLLPIIRERVKNWQKANREHRNKQQRCSRVENPFPWRARTKKYQDKLKREGLAAYGNSCQCCGETETEFLTLDHTYGGGTKHRQELKKQGKSGGSSTWLLVKKLGYPQDLFRLLCWNCNWSAHMGRGVCIHKRGTQGGMPVVRALPKRVPTIVDIAPAFGG